MQFQVFVLLVTSCKDVVLSDPCNAHRVLYEETWRSTAYIWNPGMTSMCDATIVEDWYRVNSSAGEDVVESCVPPDRCGTNNPIWMNGTLPLVTDGIVSRSMCVSSVFDCCDREIDIRVKSCGSYRVYELKQTSCPEAYCFGTLLISTPTPSTTGAPTSSISTLQTPLPTVKNHCINKDETQGHSIVIALIICVTITIVAAIVACFVYTRYFLPKIVYPKDFPSDIDPKEERTLSPPPPYSITEGDSKSIEMK